MLATVSVENGNQMIRPQVIRPLHIRPVHIRPCAHSSTYEFVPIFIIRPIQGIVSLYHMSRQFILNKSAQVHQHIQPCKTFSWGFNTC